MSNYEFVPEGDEAVSHLIIYAHGLTSKCTTQNLLHGQALLETAEKELPKPSRCGLAIVLSAGNSGKSGFTTWRLCLGGVDAGGRRLASEIATLCRDRFVNVRRVSLIGGSLGGLFARRAAQYLWGCSPQTNSPLSIPRTTIQPYALVTLATPHLGSCGLLLESSRLLQPAISLASYFFASLNELLLKSDYLPRHTRESAPVIQKFVVRAAYAPIPDDGIVPHSSAAFSLDHSPPAISPNAPPACVLVRETRVGDDALTTGSRDDTIDSPITNDNNTCKWAPAAVGPQIVAMRDILVAPGWDVIDVNLPHKHLATLYANRSVKIGGGRNMDSAAVAMDVLQRIVMEE